MSLTSKLAETKSQKPLFLTQTKNDCFGLHNGGGNLMFCLNLKCLNND